MENVHDHRRTESESLSTTKKDPLGSSRPTPFTTVRVFSSPISFSVSSAAAPLSTPPPSIASAPHTRRRHPSPSLEHPPAAVPVACAPPVPSQRRHPLAQHTPPSIATNLRTIAHPAPITQPSLQTFAGRSNALTEPSGPPPGDRRARGERHPASDPVPSYWGSTSRYMRTDHRLDTLRLTRGLSCTARRTCARPPEDRGRPPGHRRPAWRHRHQPAIGRTTWPVLPAMTP